MSNAGNIEAMQEFKIAVSSSCFIVDDSHLRIISSHPVVFNEIAILYFWDNIHLLQHYPI